jgi:DNA replication and repair protein RecF
MLKHVNLQNYRNIEDFKTNLSSEGNVLIAPNGSGKTNFLESIFYSTKGVTFRALSSNSEVIGPKENYCKVKLVWDVSEIECVVSNINNDITRRFSVNGKQIPLRKITHKYPLILFAPHSVDLVSGEPSIRRDDLNLFLASVDINYALALNKYESVLKNRNALLRNIRTFPNRVSELEIWTNQLVEAGEQIARRRYNFFSEIRTFVSIVAKEIYSDSNELDLIYNPNTFDDPENFVNVLLEKFRNNQEKEIIVGRTLYGPHKDDYSFIKDTQNLRFFGSRGQQRLAAFIIKMAYYTYFLAIRKEKNLILLDDVFSELDVKHRERLGNYLKALETQYILTTSDQKDIPESLSDSFLRIPLAEK